MSKDKNNNYARSIVRATIYGQELPNRGGVLPPHRGKIYPDTYMATLITNDPNIWGGYVIYRDETAAAERARSLRQSSAFAGQSQIVIAMRGNTVYLIKAADLHA